VVEERLVEMKPFVTVMVIIAATGLATTLVLPGRKTADVVKAGFSGLTSWTKVAQGRG
jgi:hypothetical protein